MRTSFPKENVENGPSHTFLTQKTAESEPEPEPMKYAVKIKYRGRVLAKVYKPSDHDPLYRLAWAGGSLI